MTKAILEKWLVAQKRHRLSDRQVQMARELGLNPDKLGKIDNHRRGDIENGNPLPQIHIDQRHACGAAGFASRAEAEYCYHRSTPV